MSDFKNVRFKGNHTVESLQRELDAMAERADKTIMTMTAEHSAETAQLRAQLAEARAQSEARLANLHEREKQINELKDERDALSAHKRSLLGMLDVEQANVKSLRAVSEKFERELAEARAEVERLKVHQTASQVSIDNLARENARLRRALEQSKFALQCMIIKWNGPVPGLTEQQVWDGAIAARDNITEALKGEGREG